MHRAIATEPRKGLRGALAAELALLTSAGRRGFRRGFVLVATLAFLFLAKVALFDDDVAGSRPMTLVVGLGYATSLGLVAGLVAGITAAAWRAVGLWIVVPFILIPLTLWITIAALDDMLSAQLFVLLDTAVQTARDHHWYV